MINSITLLGSSSGRNAGDAALLSAIMDGVDEACGSRLLYEIPSLNPAFVTRTYSNRTKPLGIMPWNGALKLLGIPTYRSLMRTDLSLVFDATLFDRALYNPFFNFLSSYDILLPGAKKRGKKMACYTVTIGPVRTAKGREMLRRVLELMDFITVRDQEAADLITDVGVQNENVIITSDAALNTKPVSEERISEIWKTFGFSPEKEVLALNVNPYFNSWAGVNKPALDKEGFIKTYLNGLRRALKEIDCGLLFVSTQHMDEDLTREIIERLDVPHPKALFSNRVYSHHEIRGVMSRPSLLFAMRLHCIILTSSALTPVASLNYLPKVQTFMNSLDLQDYSLGFENFAEDTMADYITRAWQDRGKIKAGLSARIPLLKQAANKAALLVAALHRGEDINRAVQKLKG